MTEESKEVERKAKRAAAARKKRAEDKANGAAPPKQSKKPNSGQFKPGDTKPARGKAFKTKLLETIKEEALLEVSKSASAETAERAFLGHWAKRAFDIDDKDSGMLFRALADRSYQPLKSALPEVEFDVEDTMNAAEKAQAVFNAIATGQIPPDVGSLLIQAAKSMTDIEANTELKERIEKLEQMLTGMNV